jgi:hypothetical protein
MQQSLRYWYQHHGNLTATTCCSQVAKTRSFSRTNGSTSCAAGVYMRNAMIRVAPQSGAAGPIRAQRC